MRVSTFPLSLPTLFSLLIVGSLFLLTSCNDPAGSDDNNPIQITGNTIFDRRTGLTWQNSDLAMIERDAAITHCQNLQYEGFNTWRLPTTAELTRFHAVTNAAGTVPNQMFDHCAADIATDGYARTKKGAELYGGNPGDAIGFSGPANVRAVRNQ